MTSVEFKSRVGADGILNVVLPLGPEEADREVRVIVEPMEVPAANHKMPRRSLPTALASERVLAKDWLRPEEDEAWQDL
jgi:hypothetical protein